MDRRRVVETAEEAERRAWIVVELEEIRRREIVAGYDRSLKERSNTLGEVKQMETQSQSQPPPPQSFLTRILNWNQQQQYIRKWYSLQITHKKEWFDHLLHCRPCELSVLRMWPIKWIHTLSDQTSNTTHERDERRDCMDRMNRVLTSYKVLVMCDYKQNKTKKTITSKTDHTVMTML